ncbi:MAG TPA: hypothetical protein VLF62_01015 [Candidatus Saccharimonadales bacterium]|nr:hypothetical protein [Candidatus Saccharimonadales bacterium]
MTATVFEAPAQQHPDALDPSQLPLTGNGITGGQTVVYSDTVAGRQPVRQLDDFEKIMAEAGHLPSYVVSAATAPAERTNGGRIYTSTHAVESARTRGPAWHEFVGSSATAQHIAPTENAATARAETTSRPRWHVRAGRFITNAALRMFSMGSETNGTEAASYAGAAPNDYVGSRRRTDTSAADVAYATTTSYVTPAKTATVLPAEPQLLYIGGHNRHAEPRHTAVAAETALVPETVVHAPATPSPKEPVAQKTPSTELVHIPRAAEQNIAGGKPQDALLQGLQEAGYDSLEAFKNAARFALPADRIAFYHTLRRIVRAKGAAWHTAANLEGDTEAQAKFTQLTTIVDGLDKELRLRPQQESADEKERKQAAGTQPDIERMREMVAASRMFRR